MKKPACFLLFLLVAVPVWAQENSQEFGFLIGGSARYYSSKDKNKAAKVCTDDPASPNCVTLNGNYRFHDRDIEAFYAVHLEPATVFKLRAGQFNSDVGVIEASNFKAPEKGHIEHVDGIIQYEFNDPFGKTGIFGGIGMYRWSGPTTPSDTNYGYTLGINADFPLTRKYGFLVEGSYHWINTSSPVRYVTLTGGLRIGF